MPELEGNTAVAEPVVTPAIETPAAPATPETPAPAESTPADPTEVIRKAVASAIPLDAEGNITKPTAQPQKPAEITPEKTAEQLEAEKQAAAATETPEQKAEREKAEAEAKTKEEAAAKEADPLDKLGPLPAERLAEALKTTPELEAALTKAGIDKDLLFETARQAALTSQFTEVFATVDEAKFGKESAGHFYSIEEGFPAIQNIEDLDKFVMDTMLPLSQLRDPQTGEPLKNPDGTFQTDGSVSRFLKLGTDYDMGMSANIADQMLVAAVKLGDGGAEQKEYAENLKAAIDYIQEFRNNGYRMPGPKAAVTELSPELRAKVEAADRTLQQAKEREAATAKEKEELFDTQVFDDTIKVTNDLISDALNRTSLDDKLKPKAAKEIMEAIGQQLLENKEYKRLSSSYRARGLTDETRKSLVAHSTRTIKGMYGKILEKVIGEYGATQIAASTARQNKIDTQVGTDRIHPSSTSAAPSKGPAPLTAEQINKQAYENAKKLSNGKEPDLEVIFQERLKLSGKAISA